MPNTKNDASNPSEASKQSSAPGAGAKVRFVEITAKNESQRIDNFLLGQLKGVPKSKIYRVIRKGEVRINKKRCKPETKLVLGDLVRIPPIVVSDSKSAPTQISDSLAEVLKDAVLFENDEVLVINKPSGLAVHGGSGVNLGLIEALRTQYSPHQFLELVHRLDRDTSGVILVAKSRPALRHLHAQFRDDHIDKFYHLLVFGGWPRRKTRVEAPLRKNELKSGERMVTVSQDGKPSQTEFKVLAKDAGFSLLEAKPITGRTHQIRVHAAFSQHPIVGDKKYIQDKVENQRGMEKCRLMLHARRLCFSLPSGKQLEVLAPYDEAFAAALEQVGMVSEAESGKRTRRGGKA